MFDPLFGNSGSYSDIESVLDMGYNCDSSMLDSESDMRHQSVNVASSGMFTPPETSHSAMSSAGFMRGSDIPRIELDAIMQSIRSLDKQVLSEVVTANGRPVGLRSQTDPQSSRSFQQGPRLQIRRLFEMIILEEVREMQRSLLKSVSDACGA